MGSSKVVPKSKYLYKDELYHVKLQLIAIDTITEYWAILNKNKVESVKGMIFYFDIKTSTPKSVDKKAVLQIQSPATEEILTFPFHLKYQIIDI